MKYRILPNQNLPKNGQLLDQSSLTLNDLQDDLVVNSDCFMPYNQLTSSNLSQSSTSSYSANRSLTNELINSTNNQTSNSNSSLTGSKFTTPQLCCIVCGDVSSGKHYGIQVDETFLYHFFEISFRIVPNLI